MNEKAYKLIEDEIGDLVNLGERLIVLASRSDDSLQGEPLSVVATWVSRSGQLIRKLYGRDSQYFEAFQDVGKKHDFTNIHGNYYDHVCQLTGILKGIQHELKRGLLVDLKKLIQASIFADF